MGWRKLVGEDHSVVEVDGRLDQSVSQAFSEFLTDAADEAAAHDEALEVDLSGVEEISSHGLRALASAQDESRRIVLTCPEGRVREILTISRLDNVFRVQAPKIHLVRATSDPAPLSPADPAPAPTGGAPPSPE
ncbi:STAS domain-containing protein [uncultured Phenylobacterium sp.]|uniref:STAS domain-containing protein n=1 Tax=uncultured Phenylobacterium sp. TaxID=349273 RepID=UPI0025D7C84E|nr:STAS domain-containing protein [uncultured Phenylobacterium sp.]